MTKNIEGTVDDDIAAKLAIGEGRQVSTPDNESESLTLVCGMHLLASQSARNSPHWIICDCCLFLLRLALSVRPT